MTEFLKFACIHQFYYHFREFYNNAEMSDNLKFKAFLEEVGDILPLSTQNPQSLQKSIPYLEMKIQDLDLGKQRFSRNNQVNQINLLVEEIRNLKNGLKVNK